MAKELSNTELRAELKKYGITAGPLTDTTRSVYLKKLEKLKNDHQKTPPKRRSLQKETTPPIYGSKQNEITPQPTPKYGSIQNENVAPKYDSSVQKKKLNDSAARLISSDWCRTPKGGWFQTENADTTPKYDSPFQKEKFNDNNTDRFRSTATKYGSFQNENVAPKYGSSSGNSSLQRNVLNSSAADWYRSRLHDNGSWVNNSYSTGTYGGKRRWWSLNANAPRWILYIFAGFIALLASLYALTMNKDTVKFCAVLLFGAMVDTVYFVYNHMILPALIVLLIAGVIVGAIWYKRHKWHKSAEEQQLIFDMVEKILALLKKHYEDCLVDNNRQPYLAVPHVRDMLIPLGKRKQMLPIWDKAVQYLNENESRVRTENQIISGEEFMVWRWLQSNADDKLWQGHAFPEEQAAMNSPLMPFSECLKLRGLFDPDLEEEDEWPEHVQDAILEKLGQSIRVMHVAIDTESKEGCVYMKLGTKEEAGAAYQILHGSWFNGRLVTVKYLRVERYHERFPEAQRCTFPLRIKKPRYSLLG